MTDLNRRSLPACLRSAVIAVVFVCMTWTTVTAHPLGNFTSNHLTRISFEPRSIVLHYVLDDAEIPTFSLLRSLDSNGRPSSEALEAWAARNAAATAPQLELTVDGRPATLTPTGSDARLRPGAAGLQTLYFTADYRAPLPAGPTRVAFHDATLPGRIGWKDVVVAPRREPTDELRNYPNALLGSPRDRTAVVAAVDARGTVTVADADDTPFGVSSTARMNELSDVLARNLSDPLVLLGALLLAVALGALHALEPGHGKTLLAISLVGARATISQAVLLASSLTVAHTIGVLAFGVIVLALARFVVPEALYPWIAVLSGALVAVLGARALAREIGRRREGQAHDHNHDHDHNHHEHDHHQHHHHYHERHGAIGFRGAALAASAGNLAPCPAALVVLLAAIATHRIGYGLILIVAFGSGLALTLTVLGVAVVRGAGWLTRRPQFDRLARYAPLASATVISLIGSWMIGEGLAAQGVSTSPLWTALPVAAAIAFYVAFPFTPLALPRRAS